MCGRYVVFTDKENQELRDIVEEVERNNAGKIKVGEVFPTDFAPVLVEKERKITAVSFQWGYPNYSKKGIIINARSETAAEKKTFRESLLYQRCIIPSSGFYEWTHNKQKQKYLFTMPQRPILYMAGLFRLYDGIPRFVILTTEANDSMQPIHNRMPVVLHKSELESWLRSPEDAMQILQKKPLILARSPVIV